MNTLNTTIPIIDERELEFSFIRSSGPGGQNVNKVSTAVELRFDFLSSPSLSPYTKNRLATLAKNRLTFDGKIAIFAQRFRSQLQNRQDAIDRLNMLLVKASEKPLLRKKTKPSKASGKRRLEAKSRHADAKRLRGSKHSHAE